MKDFIEIPTFAFLWLSIETINLDSSACSTYPLGGTIGPY